MKRHIFSEKVCNFSNWVMPIWKVNIIDFRSPSEWYTVSAVQRSQLREIEDNGEFWMPWSKFWRIFTDLTVCSITPDYDADGISDGLGK